MLEKITLIDGEFLRGLCSEYGRQVKTDIFGNIDWRMAKFSGGRAFFYDALPVQKKNQDKDTFETEFRKRIEELNGIRRSQDWHVRDGLSRLRQKDNRREQKGVDILLAIDAMQFAFQGTAELLTIVTSDTDFYPVFEALQQTSCKGILRYQEGKTSDELIYSADQATPLYFYEILNWLKPEAKELRAALVPNFSKCNLIEEDSIIEYPTRSGRIVTITKNTETNNFHVYVNDPRTGLACRKTPFRLIVEETIRADYHPIGGNVSEILKYVKS